MLCDLRCSFIGVLLALVDGAPQKGEKKKKKKKKVSNTDTLQEQKKNKKEMEFELKLAKEKEEMYEREKQLKINRLVQEVREHLEWADVKANRTFVWVEPSGCCEKLRRCQSLAAGPHLHPRFQRRRGRTWRSRRKCSTGWSVCVRLGWSRSPVWRTSHRR